MVVVTYTVCTHVGGPHNVGNVSLIFCVPTEGFPLELSTSTVGQKTRMMGYRADKEV